MTLADDIRNEEVNFCLGCDRYVKPFRTHEDRHKVRFCPKCDHQFVEDDMRWEDKRKRMVQTHPWGS